MSAGVRYDKRGLEQVLKLVRGSLPKIRLGVLGQDADRPDEELNNAEIGAKHEMGASDTVRRSFLRDPVSEKMKNYIQKSSAGMNEKNEAFKESIRQGSLVPYMKKVAVLGETIVQDAFDTGGFGQWKPSNMKYKTNHQTLVETQQLRNSISSEVVEE